MIQRPLVIGHRGAAGHAPENTLAAFRTGLRLGADGVECDVHMSRDGQIVILHDATVDRTTNGTGSVGELTLAELQQLDAGSWYGSAFAGERIPTLRDLFALLAHAELEAGRNLWLVIELKFGNDVYPGIEEVLAQEIAQYHAPNRVMVIGFDHRAMARLKALSPALRTGVLYYARPLDSLGMARAAGADLLGPSVDWVDAEEVRAAREAGIGIFVWTANAEAAIRRIGTLGVMAVGSDYPERLLAIWGQDASLLPSPFSHAADAPLVLGG